jgi:hypothetical protein
MNSLTVSVTLKLGLGITFRPPKSCLTALDTFTASGTRRVGVEILVGLEEVRCHMAIFKVPHAKTPRNRRTRPLPTDSSNRRNAFGEPPKATRQRRVVPIRKWHRFRF